MNFMVIIPSKNASNLVACLMAIRRHEPDARVVVVDDGDGKDIALACASFGALRLRGAKPFIYARNINRGIAGTFDKITLDVITGEPVDPTPRGALLLNDDAILETPGGLSALAQACADHPEYGLISARIHAPICAESNINGPVNEFGIRDEPRMVAFVCTYIPRATIEKVGLLDEQFAGYGCDDDDYCLRVRNAGLKIGVLDSVRVNHAELPSTYRPGNGRGNFAANAELFRAKWGHGLYGPDDQRNDIAVSPDVRPFIATPCYGGACHTAYAMSLLQTCHILWDAGIRHTVKLLPGDSLVQRARNMLVAHFLAGDWTHLLFIDGDIQWQPGAVTRLLAAAECPDIEVCCGVYPKKSIPATFPCNFVIGEGQRANAHPKTGFIEVKDAPTGFLLIKRAVIERMMAAYPERRCVFDPDAPEYLKPYQFALFDCFVDDKSNHYLSEDFGFSRLYQRLGGHIWMDPECRLGHYGQHRYTGDISSVFEASR